MFGKILNSLKSLGKGSEKIPTVAPLDSKFIHTGMDGEYFGSVYTFLEYVFLPSNFDITTHLNMREQAGIFKYTDIDLRNLILLAESIKYSPVFCSLNNPNLNPKICGFLMSVLSELGLVVTTIPNPLRSAFSKLEYDTFCEQWDKQKIVYFSGTTLKSSQLKILNFVVINLYQLFDKELVKDYIQKAIKIEKEQREFEINLKELTLGK